MKQLLGFCLLCLCLQTAAQGSMDYYQAVVPVKSQSAAARKFAAQQGLEQVLVRMSASDTVLESKQIQQAVDRAQSFVEQYQFRLVEDEALKARGYREEMTLVFSPELIQRLLHQARVRFWAEGNRPRILVWLVEDHAEYGKQLINNENTTAEGEAHPVVAALKRVARERGLPLEFPLLDLEDQTNISAEDIWHLREDDIRAASERYSPPVVLAGRFSSTSRGELWSTWQYYHMDFNRTWDNRAEQAEKFAHQALAPLNEFLAERYAVVPGVQGESGALVLRLGGITSYQHFRQALDYLSGLAMVMDVNVLEAGDGNLLLAVKSDAGFQRFDTSVQLDKKLELQPQQSTLPEWQQLPRGTQENPAEYRWLGT